MHTNNEINGALVRHDRNDADTKDVRMLLFVQDSELDMGRRKHRGKSADILDAQVLQWIQECEFDIGQIRDWIRNTLHSHIDRKGDAVAVGR